MALIEAMATEVPVIATNVGGAGEIITDGRDGLLLPPRQPDRWVTAVERLVEQPELRRTLGHQGAADSDPRTRRAGLRAADRRRIPRSRRR